MTISSELVKRKALKPDHRKMQEISESNNLINSRLNDQKF